MMGRCARVAALLSLCVAHAAFALGLGEIELHSALNQPLKAQIPLLGVDSGERGNVEARIASPEAFARVGLERSPVLSDVRIRITDGPNEDQSILELSTLQIVREPYLSLLLEVESSGGARVLREYTVLLDPPLITPGRSASTRPAYATGGVGARGPTAVQPSAINSPGRSYGPVQAQETLWRIAYNLRPDPQSISMDQMQIAIYRANPEAFEGGITHIRAGSYLRIPSADEIRRIDPELAKQEVARVRRGGRQQVLRDEDAGALTNRPARPTRIRPRPVAPKPAPVEAPAPSGQLRLTPPAAPAAVPAVPAQSQTGVASPSSAPVQNETGTAVIPPPPEVAPSATAAPVQIRDNSMKALELLAVHARQAAARGQTVPSAPPSPVAASPAPASPSPFVDEQPPATAAPGSTPAGQGSANQPGGVDASPGTETPATESPGTETVDVWADGKKPPETKKFTVDDSIPAATKPEEFLSPTRMILGGLLLLLLVVGLYQYRKRRMEPAKPLPLMPIGDRLRQPADTLGETQQFAPLSETRPMSTPALRTAPVAAPKPPVAQSPAPDTVRLSQPQPPKQQPTPSFAQTAPVASPTTTRTPPAPDAYADVLAEADIHIAYGLYDEAARLLEDPLSKSPQRGDLHLKMLEVYFSAGQANDFLAQAQKLRKLVSGPQDPSWEKACIMGRQICPDSELFADTDGTSNVSTLGTSADLDISALLPSEPTPVPVATSATPPAAVETLDWQDLKPFEADLTTATPTLSVEAEPAQQTPTTLEFDLSDFKMDAAAPLTVSAAPPQAAKADVDAFEGLDIDLSDFDMPSATPATATPAAPVSPAVQAQPSIPEITLDSTDGGSVFDTGDDPLLSGSSAGNSGQMDTRLDLARAYIDMGEPAMAQSLLQEVAAQGSVAQKQEAQDLLKRIPA